jgi:hypothetical protein
MMLRNFFILMMVVATSMANAQGLIKPGDQQIRYELIRPQHNFYKLVLVDSAGNKQMEMLNEEIISIDSVKKQLIRTQFRSFGGGRLLTDSTIADLHTLSPVRMRMVTNPSVMQMDLSFRKTDVHAVANKGGKHTDTVHHMQEGYFDSNLIEYLFQLLPYKEGFFCQINAYTFEKDGMDPHTVKYIGEEMVEDPGGSIRKMNVAEVRSKDGQSIDLLWFDQRTGKVYKHTGRFGNRRFIITTI